MSLATTERLRLLPFTTDRYIENKGDDQVNYRKNEISEACKDVVNTIEGIVSIYE
jgi:hypothetical protein